MNSRLAYGLIALFLAVAAPAGAEDAPMADARPGASVYALDVALDSATGAALHLSDFAGQPVVVTMFYSRCTYVCPALTLSLQRIEAALAPAERERVRFLMVSLDDVNDTPSVLATFAQSHHLEAPRWTVAHAGAADVRLLAAGLDIRYRRLPDGTFSHSSVITVLDADGVVRVRSSDLSGTDPTLLSLLRVALH